MPTTHVTSLELSRRLKELKVPQTSQFYWYACPDNLICGRPNYVELGKKEVAERVVYSAYLASELGEMIYKNHKLMVCPNWEDRGVYRMQYDLQWWCEGKTLADVYAKMLIYLLENHLISVEELGK